MTFMLQLEVSNHKKMYSVEGSATHSHRTSIQEALVQHLPHYLQA